MAAKWLGGDNGNDMKREILEIDLGFFLASGGTAITGL